MSAATKKRLVTRQQLAATPILPDDRQRIAIIVNSCGNNLHQVDDEFDNSYLVSMPSKFRKSVWVRRGDFVLVEPIDEGDKVKAEICRILDADAIDYYCEQKRWPIKFDRSTIVDSDTKKNSRIGAQNEMIDDDMWPSSSDESSCDNGTVADDDDDGDVVIPALLDGDKKKKKKTTQRRSPLTTIARCNNPNRRARSPPPTQRNGDSSSSDDD